MRKKLFSFLSAVILCLCFTLFSACGQNSNENNNIQNNEQESSQNNGQNDDFDADNETYYTVAFESQGGSAVESQRILKGNPVRTPSTPTNGELLFQGWFVSADASAEEWNFETGRVNGDMTLYAHWAPKTTEQTESISFEKTADGTGYIVTGAGDEAEIVIPETHDNLPVVEIGESAFAYSKHKSDIVSVTIPDSVTKIGLNAFHNQDALETVNIGTSSKLVSIGNNAFSGNSALKGFYLPEGAIELGDDIFNNCGSLNSFTVASGNTAYSGEGNNFIDLSTHTLIRGTNSSEIPSSVTEIAPAAFRRANGITEITIPLSVVTIGNYVFMDSTITKIKYEGSEEQWNNIKKAKNWDMSSSLTVEYTSSQDDKDTVNILIAYFSRTGENYGVGDMSGGGYAGYIEKGNTEIVAEMIAEMTGGDLFEIVPVTPYPDSYSEMLEVAQNEARSNARPKIKDTVENFENYDVIFLGYPIWNGNCPNILQTFMESYDFSGKTVIPFCTHAGSGLGSSMRTIQSKLPSADVVEGLAITGKMAQNDKNSARSQVESFLEEKRQYLNNVL